MESQTFRPELEQGLQQLGISLSRAQIDQLLDFHQLLLKWNKAYNLTAVRDSHEMISRHLLDSLSVLPFITGTNILDVGSGGGLPGIPFAICFPDKKFTLLDGNGKKTRFLTQCKVQLQLTNLHVIHNRAEQFNPPEQFDQVTSRAFTAIENMVNWCAHLCHDHGEFVAMKGTHPAEELKRLPAGYAVKSEHVLQVPGCTGERHLIIIAKTP